MKIRKWNNVQLFIKDVEKLGLSVGRCQLEGVKNEHDSKTEKRKELK